MQNRGIRTLAISFVSVLFVATFTGRLAAVSLSLGVGGPMGVGVRADTTCSLYASDFSGKAILLTEVGMKAPGGGTLADLGVPAMTWDGRVLFGAEVAGKDPKVRTWQVFLGNPRSPAERLTRALNVERGICVPAFKTDPYPVADGEGNIAFLAPDNSGHDALFFYSSGELACVARAGDLTDHGHRIAILGFGTLQMGEPGEMVLRGWLKPDKDKKGDRSVLLMVSRAGGIRELAASGETGPGGARYSDVFSLPAVVPSPEGTMVAFTNKTSSGGALFLYRGRRMARVLLSGALTPLGPVGYLSLGRPGLGPDGTIAVLGSCARVPVVLRLQRGRMNLAARQGMTTPFGDLMVAFGDPALTASGDMFFGATDDKDNERIYILSNEFGLLEAGVGPIQNISYSGPGPSHYIFSGTLTVNQRGDFAYLGGKE